MITRNLTEGDVGLPVIINLVNPSDTKPKMYGKITAFNDEVVFVDCSKEGKEYGFPYHDVTIDKYSVDYPKGGVDLCSEQDQSDQQVIDEERANRRLDVIFGKKEAPKSTKPNTRSKKL